jgi:hypothetical protein
MAKKITPIKYTGKDFQSIKKNLVEYAKRYYPDTFQDFSEASFGSLLMDTVAYVGDVLSFYLDYQANESFLQTAIEYQNVLKIAEQMGYRHRQSFSSTGLASFYLVVPRVGIDMGPDSNYTPTLKRGSLLTSETGTSFTLNEDIDFADASHKVLVASANSSTGAPTHYAIRAYGEVISGEMNVQNEDVGGFVPMRKIFIQDENVTEIMRVYDSEGHEYVEVDYLTQDVVYRKIINKTRESDTSPLYVMKPESAPRRFIVRREGNFTYIQFGYGSDSTLKDKPVTKASDVVLKSHGKDYISSKHFDPSRLKDNDKLGVGPSETQLTIVFRSNNREDVNIPSRALTRVVSPIFEFTNRSRLQNSLVNEVISSLEVVNEGPIIGDISVTSIEELRMRAGAHYSAQNRAVTLSDYQSLVYRMPPSFGSVKHCSVGQDLDSIRRNLNLYVISEDYDGYLVKTNDKIKQNLKTWISDYKMVNDTVDILDAKIINFGIEFELLAAQGFNKYDVLSLARAAIITHIEEKSHGIGESLQITEFYKILNQIDAIADVVKIRVTHKTGGQYSTTAYDLLAHKSSDGRVLHIPSDTILELKFPSTDIQGTII